MVLSFLHGLAIPLLRTIASLMVQWNHMQKKEVCHLQAFSELDRSGRYVVHTTTTSRRRREQPWAAAPHPEHHHLRLQLHLNCREDVAHLEPDGQPWQCSAERTTAAANHQQHAPPLPQTKGATAGHQKRRSDISREVRSGPPAPGPPAAPTAEDHSSIHYQVIFLF